MKTVKLSLKPITYFLAFLILFQGCTVYNTQNLSLEQAAATKDKAKIVTKQNETLKYLYITKIDDKFYGVKMVNNQLIKIPVEENNLDIIRLKDKRASNTASILLGVVGGLGAAFIIAMAIAFDTAESISDSIFD